MLNEEQKSQIRAEEYFKYEVRKSLEKKQKVTAREKAWILLNSSFGLWVLSTVVVGFIVSSYSKYQEKVTVQKQNQETQRRLETEVSSRIQHLHIELKRILSSKEFYSMLLKRTAISIDAGATKVEADNPVNVFPDFEKRTLQSLIFELEQLTKDENEKNKFKQSRIIMYNIKQSLVTLPESYREPDEPLNDETVRMMKDMGLQSRKTYQEQFQKNSIEYQRRITQALELMNTNYYLKKWIND